jgi:hypothetical protein
MTKLLMEILILFLVVIRFLSNFGNLLVMH